MGKQAQSASNHKTTRSFPKQGLEFIEGSTVQELTRYISIRALQLLCSEECVYEELHERSNSEKEPAFWLHKSSAPGNGMKEREGYKEEFLREKE